MIRLGSYAERNIDELTFYYEDYGRPLAAKGLLAAVDQAALKIERSPAGGLPAPRPYPELARLGRRWVKQGVYWIAYTTTAPPVISAIFHESANIPGRIRAADARGGT